MTHYDILDCSPNASSEELKQAYHRKALQFHPDKNDKSNSDEFIKVQEAWKIVGNAETRKQYDSECQQANFESQYALIYARLLTDDLRSTEDEEVLSYDCRCGSEYLVYKSDILEKNQVTHVPCQECTFVIEIET